VVFVAGDDALDQYHVSHPESFFGQAMEQAVVDPSNASIQLGHLLCAAQEQPLVEADLELFPANAASLVARLAGAGELSDSPPWRAPGSPAHAHVALRGATREPYTLQTPRGSLGTVESPHLLRECYPGALYLHNGRGYRVLGIEDGARVVRLTDAPAEERTSPLLEVEVAPRGEPLASRDLALMASPIRATAGPLVVRESVVGYREHHRGEALTHALDRPLVTTLETVGLWLDLPEGLEPDRPAVHAFEHALVHALPLVLLCDRRDLSSSNQPACGASGEGELAWRVYVYDLVEGGIGLAAKSFHLLEELLERARSLLRDCPCTEGCPNCVHLAGCAAANTELDKVGGLALLEGRSVGPARVASHLLRPSAGLVSGVGRERRQRLRDIAEADLRDRFMRPAWLEVGGLARLPDIGVVVVWSIDGSHARVQPLQGGLPRSVPIAHLQQPA
jgi:DEAD/DEAH box helicase domain-containing protein